MIIDYLRIGDAEVINTARTQAYMRNVGSPFTSGASWCGCETLTPAMIGEEAQPGDPGGIPRYDTPATDPAPWFDPDQAVTGDFLGFLPLSMAGLDDSPRVRNVTNAVGGGGIFGPVRDLPRTITVTGLLIGASCCGVEFGLHWLAESLAGCTGDTCSGDCLTVYNCCPDESMTKAAFDAEHRRTLRRVALVSGPTVTDRVGSGESCARGTCGANGDIIQVEFVLVAGSPWPWTDTIELLDVNLPIGGTGDCIEWCLKPQPGRGTLPADTTGQRCNEGECVHAPCTAATDPCADPNNAVPAPPTPTAPDASFCIPIASERACYSVDLSTRPQWSSDVPMITVRSGATALRNLRITIYEKPVDTTLTCDQVADANRCGSLNDFYITYVPPNGAVTIDGQINQATIECEGDCRTASTVFGSSDGGPLRIREMTCAEFCICLETDPNLPPAADASVSFSVSGRGY